MAKNFILKCMLAIVFLPVTQLWARENTPIETFIRHVKQTNNFVTVNNIWQPDNSFDQKEMLQIVEKGQPMTIDYVAVATFMKQKATAISLVLPGVGGGSYTVDLARYDFLTNDFQLHEMGTNGADKAVSYTPGLYYSGVVNGIPGSVAAFSFFNNEIYGIFSIPGEGNYVVAPNTMVGNSYDYNQHYLLYNDKDLINKHLAPGCATDDLPEPERNVAAKTTTTLNNKVYNNCTQVRCFEVADYAMFVKKAGTTNCTNYLTALFNNKSTLYRNEGISIVLKYVQVNTATDAYQSLALSSSTWLNKFGEVTMNVLHGCDMACLFTTHTGNMGGVSWLGLLCDSYHASNFAGPYSFCNVDNVASTSATPFPTYSWDVEVSTHEMGHMVGSPHTHRCCWNPPARTTAIDKCTALEGSCANPVPLYPTVGGTIMSYCHFQSVGINFSQGFGPQPGDTVRYYLSHTFSSTCGQAYNPSVALSKANRSITANRECVDMNTGTTYYWKDNNTADPADDTLVLMLKKNGNDIGDLNDAAFSVSANTIASYGSGTGATITFPTGTPVSALATHYSMRRYWKLNVTTEPTTAVDVIYPFLPTDTADVSGSMPGGNPLTNYKIYNVKTPIDPKPAAPFASAVATDFNIYTYGAAPTITNWSLTTVGTTQLATFKTKRLSGGGTAFYTNSTAGVEDVNGGQGSISIYPNPTTSEWFIAAGPNSNGTMSFQLYTADGRLVQSQTLQSGVTNTVNAAALATGIYFYRIVSGTDVYTGNLMKN